MDLFSIHHKSGLAIRLARFPFKDYFAFDATVQDLHTLYHSSGNRPRLLLRRKSVRDAIAWCLSLFPVQGYCPDDWIESIVKNDKQIYRLFFEIHDGVRGELYAWAIATPNLVYGEPSDIESSGDVYIDMMSGLVFQGQYSDAIALVNNHSMQDIIRLNWRMSLILNPQKNQQQRGEKKLIEAGVKDKMDMQMLMQKVKMQQEFEERMRRNADNN